MCPFMQPLRSIQAAPQRDAQASAEIPSSAGVGPGRRENDSRPLNVLDPVQILGEYSAAAATDDVATLIACNDAHRQPIRTSTSAIVESGNPSRSRNAGAPPRQSRDRAMGGNKSTLASGLAAVIADLEVAACLG